ncbi:MAG: transaldolase family protein [Candidatus Limnocylindrales bacterium]
MTLTDSPLQRTVETSATDYWNDSCAVDELAYAIERGATGATSNPSIVLEVLRKERARWMPRARELMTLHPTWSEVELTWAIIEEMVVRGASLLLPIFEREGGRKGRLSVQTNPADYRDAARMLDQSLHLAGLAPNLQVKFPVTAAGLVAVEEATARGVNITATVSFTVAQALAAAEAVERGLDRRDRAGDGGAPMAPVCVLMIGRLDDWLKAIVERDGLALEPGALDWAGIAVFKRAYELFRERGYRSRLLAAAFRHRLHWTELVGGDVILTIPYAWQLRFNASGIDPQPRMAELVDSAIITELSARLPDFRRAYEPDGLAPHEFDSYGATVRTLRSFIAAYHDLMSTIRDVMLPDPTTRAP